MGLRPVSQRAFSQLPFATAQKQLKCLFAAQANAYFPEIARMAELADALGLKIRRIYANELLPRALANTSDTTRPF